MVKNIFELAQYEVKHRSQMISATYIVKQFQFMKYRECIYALVLYLVYLFRYLPIPIISLFLLLSLIVIFLSFFSHFYCCPLPNYTDLVNTVFIHYSSFKINPLIQRQLLFNLETPYWYYYEDYSFWFPPLIILSSRWRVTRILIFLDQILKICSFLIFRSPVEEELSWMQRTML